MAERYYTADEVKAQVAAGRFYFPCDPNQDPVDALLAELGPNVFSTVMEDQLEAARQRRIGVDRARVIDGETIQPERKEIES